MFNTTKFDASLYNGIKEGYLNGKSYKINKTDYEDNVLETIDCPTLIDFEREIWDKFAFFAERECYNLVFGAPMGLKERNPHKSTICYYDGMIFSLLREEFKKCIEEQDVVHFFSCLQHYGYERMRVVENT